MTSTIIPAANGIRAIYPIPGGRVVLRAVIAWHLRTGFEPRAEPVTLVTRDALPGSGELGLADPAAVVFENGHVESIDGSKSWASVGDYCASKSRKLVGA